MNIAMSVDQKIRMDNSKYLGSMALIESFERRSHNLSLIHPDEIYTKSGDIYVKKIFGFKDEKFYQKGEDARITGDAFLVYGLGEDAKNPDMSKRFIDSLAQLENQYEHVLNNAVATSYEFKSFQSGLDLPWIPRFNIKSQKDLKDLIDSGEKIIAKPTIGCAGNGILYYGSITDLDKINESKLSDYVFEKYIEASEERRYIFLDRNLIVRRRIEKSGDPGKEEVTLVDLMEGDSNEIKIARSAIDKMDMFYGAVDFRGDYLLEVNGSGTGVISVNTENSKGPYDLSSVVVQAIERKVGK